MAPIHSQPHEGVESSTSLIIGEKQSKYFFQSWDQWFCPLMQRGPIPDLMPLTCPAPTPFDSSALNLEMCPIAHEPPERRPEDYCSFLVTWSVHFTSLEVTQALVGKQAGMGFPVPLSFFIPQINAGQVPWNLVLPSQGLTSLQLLDLVVELFI